MNYFISIEFYEWIQARDCGIKSQHKISIEIEITRETGKGSIINHLSQNISSHKLQQKAS